MIIKLEPSSLLYDVTINKQLMPFEVESKSVSEYIEVLDIDTLLKIIKVILVSFKPGKRLKFHKQAAQAQVVCKEQGIIPLQILVYLVDRVYYDKLKTRITYFDVNYFVCTYLDSIGIRAFSASVKANNVSKYSIDDILSLVAISETSYQYINLEDLVNINLVLDDNTNESE